MSHSHDHVHAAAGGRARIVIAIAIIGAFLVVQVVGALVSGSLALLADAGHMAGDLVGLLVALGAAMIAARPANDRQTYGFQRFEVLGALVNGVLLVVVAVTVAIGAIDRLLAGASGEAHEVQGGPMLVVAIAGLAANLAAMLVLRAGAKGSINVRGAYLEVLGDAIGSILVIAAAGVILMTGWDAADVIASLAIAALILPRALLLLRDVLRVLSQAAPADVRVGDIREHLLRTPGVLDVHDVHVWAITTGAHVFSAHVVAEPDALTGERQQCLLDDLGECLADHFDVAHSTFQLESAEHAAHEHPSHA
ncbi:cation diffusion facilitator family transporter [Agromyces larvae]|uniref:Cation diffusion facilitator family transporter n=1 Tax=Agromyces larvae TaxID=2929802 RepID=A0ABY4C242_9MICO|nr:cation diffusion facilitator family transporter [Agromyces larvae]UOE45545.1 cation diffusion facilitator family transporter [Agromyces larvae]